MARSFTSYIKIMALISLLYNYYTIKTRGIIILIFISNLLLFYFSKSNILNFINNLSVLTTVAAATVAAAAFAATKIYEVIITCVKTGFLSFFFYIFYFLKPFLYFLIIFILKLPNQLNYSV